MSEWAARAARARVLAGRYPAAAEILNFYAGLAEWQGSVTGRSPEEIYPSLLELVRRTGPKALAAGLSEQTRSFFERALAQPYLVAHRLDASPAGGGGSLCPWCGHPPQTGCLQPEGDGLALQLVCSMCFGRWTFPRLRCPACGEQAEGGLVYYSAPEFEHLRLEACETCRVYLQLVDLSRDPAAVPEVDELAGLPLDLWAQEQGYAKLQVNLFGW